MKLNHLNLPVENVAETSAFFEQYFGFRKTDSKGENLLSVLTGEDGFVLVIMANTFNKDNHAAYPDAFHIGFLQDSREAVMAVYDRLKAGGVGLDRAPGNMRGVFGFYFRAPGNILIEVSCVG